MPMAILVTNVKGGCGKTTIATNLAAAIARSGLVTAVADLDRRKSSKAARNPRGGRSRATDGIAESRPPSQTETRASAGTVR